MCGRIAQTRSVRNYLSKLGMPVRDDFEDLDTPTGNYNAGPAVPQWVIRRIEDGSGLPEKLRWQWRSAWAREKNLTPQINAVLSKLLGGFYRPLMVSGRIIVPADGWYEWTKEGKIKQPWYIRPKDGQPIFMAALTDLPPGVEGGPDSGFVIVTDESSHGMVDIHDRRPVILRPEDARDWMDLGFDYKQAEMIARERALPSDAFEWYKVSTDVNSTKMHDAHLIEPI